MRFLLILLVSAGTFPLGAQNLVHHIDFDTDGVVADMGTAAAGNGTLVGGARVSGGFLELNGSGAFVQFAAHLIPTSPSYTVSLYARASAGANGGASRDFISQGSSGAAFYIGIADDGSLRAGDNWPSVEGASFKDDGEWHHYAITMTASEAAFFVDGVLVATNAPFAGGAGGSGTRLGRGAGSASAFFNGSIDDVRVYDDVLTRGQIQGLRSRPPRTAAAQPGGGGRQ